MLPKINRITKKKDFEVIFRKAKSIKSNLFILRVAKNNLGLNRFGFVISQKVSKLATVRNKVRRRLREIVKVEFDNIKKGNDLVFIATREIENSDFLQIKECFHKVLIESKLIEK